MPPFELALLTIDLPFGDWRPFEWATLFLLYAEIHYHFKIAPSLLYRRQPEIVADAPHRLDPHQPLPILVLLKDAHRFPIELLAVTLEISAARSFRIELLRTAQRIETQWWWRVFHVSLPEDLRGRIKANVVIDYRCRGKVHRCYNDNYRGTSHTPLEIFVADATLPTLPGFYHGDLHTHTNATSDQVEYGAPLLAVMELAKAQGLAFFAATDHSYDLDDFPDDYLRNDPELRKWHGLQEEVRQLNASAHDFVIIPGEEVSCGNAKGENVHFLVLNPPRFIRGRGDGGEKWLQIKPDHTIAEALDMLGPDALAFAAHPSAPIPRLERLLLGRGNWAEPDFEDARLRGLQFWNGKAAGEEKGFAHWRRLLLEGRKLFAIAGNDAHGNFNRYRQIAWPCLSMRECSEHLFGCARTAVKVDGQFDLNNVLAALRHGRAVITTGPMLDLQVECADGSLAQMGETVAASATHAIFTAISSTEFGKLEYVKLWRGELSQEREELWFECSRFMSPYEYHLKLSLPQYARDYYLRMEAATAVQTQSARPRVALSNPIWICNHRNFALVMPPTSACG